jgi:hypothetical protein
MKLWSTWISFNPAPNAAAIVAGAIPAGAGGEATG